MKIAWCTPFSTASAIARVTRVDAAELSHYADVDIWYDPAVGDPLATSLTTQPWLGEPSSHGALSQYDAVIYSMGNHWKNHAAVYSALVTVPGIVIMHDVGLGDFFASHFLANGDRAGYVEAIRRMHGNHAGRLAARRFNEGVRWYPDSAHTLSGMAIEHALGVVTHSHFAAAKMSTGLGRVTVLPLTFGKFGENPPTTSTAARSADRVRLLIFGHIHEGRRSIDVVRALGRDPDLAGRVHLVIAGLITLAVRSALEREIHDLRLEDAVTIVGYIDDHRLNEEIHAADVCIGLREPVVEAASASLIEAMWYGKPVVVPDAGWYAELPRECVAHVSNNHDSLLQILRHLVDDGAARRDMGEHARQYARREFTPDRYVMGLRNAITEGMAARPLFDLARSLSLRARETGIASSGPGRGALARAAGELYEGRLPVHRNGVTPEPGADGRLSTRPPIDEADLSDRVLRSGARERTVAVLGRLADDRENKPPLMKRLNARALPGDAVCVHTFLNWYSSTHLLATYLGVGVRRGWSMAQVAVGSPSCSLYGIDMWAEGYAGAPNPGPAFVEAEMWVLGHRGRIRFANGDSHDLLPHIGSFGLPPGETEPWPAQFDCILVDGDHHIGGALADLRDTMPLVAPGGVMVFDDLGYEGDERHFGTADPADTRSLPTVWQQIQTEFPGFRFLSYGEGEHGVGIAYRLDASG